MFKVGIIGSENSHATAFTEIFNVKQQYEDVRVVAVYGEDPEASQKISDKYGVPIVKPEDMLPMVDAVMITSRHGGLHYGYAKPFIEAGKPLFVDKPLCCCAKEAKEMLDLAKAKNVPIVGGSSLKVTKDTFLAKAKADEARAKGELFGGLVYAPINLDNPYGGYYFYSAHLMETLIRVFGYDPVAVTAKRYNDSISGVVEYKDFAVSYCYTAGAYNYGCTIVAKDADVNVPISLDGAYDAEVSHFVEMLHTGVSPQTYTELLLPVKLLNAIEKAFTENVKVTIE